MFHFLYFAISTFLFLRCPWLSGLFLFSNAREFLVFVIAGFLDLKISDIRTGDFLEA